MAAEIFGSVFLAISAVIIIFELHQNVKQRKIQNTFMRSVEDENYFYKSMEKDFSKLFVKAGKPCSELEEYEKNQLKSFIFVTMSIINRDYLVAAETTYLQHRSRLKVRLNAHVKRVFSQPAIPKCIEYDLINLCLPRSKTTTYRIYPCDICLII